MEKREIIPPQILPSSVKEGLGEVLLQSSRLSTPLCPSDISPHLRGEGFKK